MLEWILFAGSKKRIRTLLGSIKPLKTPLRSEHAFQNVRFAFCVVNVLRSYPMKYPTPSSDVAFEGLNVEEMTAFAIKVHQFVYKQPPGASACSVSRSAGEGIWAISLYGHLCGIYMAYTIWDRYIYIYNYIYMGLYGI